MDIKKIKRIIRQYDGPIKLSYQTKVLSGVTILLVEYHKINIEKLDSYDINEIFSLIAIIEYAINDLGEDEFNSVTGLDLYKDGYPLLNQLKKRLLKFD